LVVVSGSSPRRPHDDGVARFCGFPSRRQEEAEGRIMQKEAGGFRRRHDNAQEGRRMQEEAGRCRRR
jgi:hypothetical protein